HLSRCDFIDSPATVVGEAPRDPGGEENDRGDVNGDHFQCNPPIQSLRKRAPSNDLRRDHTDNEEGPDHRKARRQRLDPYSALRFFSGYELRHQKQPGNLIGRMIAPRPPDVEVLEAEAIVITNGDGMESM